VSANRGRSSKAADEARSKDAGQGGARRNSAGQEDARRGSAKRDGRRKRAETVTLQQLLNELPDDLSTSALTHASWTARRSDSYERLAFLGDSVLALAVTTHLYPRLGADEFGAGELTKIRAQSVSGRSCRAVAERLGIPDRLRAAAPEDSASAVESLVTTERVLASVIEAVIGACYLAYGYERTAEAVVEAFTPEIDDALEHPGDYKSTLQERLARRGELVSYEVVDEHGPPHDRRFQISAVVGGSEVGRGIGRSKKDAEQEAAREALESLR
jgi:ribonuclease-3